jgi:hypothetical protein
MYMYLLFVRYRHVVGKDRAQSRMSSWHIQYCAVELLQPVCFSYSSIVRHCPFSEVYLIYEKRTEVRGKCE